jgi:ssDNA-binding Zn-finger/Zn-ribbon topoisomerase 1
MICPECEKGLVRLKLSHRQGFDDGFFSKSLSGFQTVPCPECSGSGVAYSIREENYDGRSNTV